MGQLQSSIGLITGLPIQDTVDQLINIQARPVQLLASRNQTLSSEQVAVADLTARLLGVQLAVDKLGNASTFSQKKITSSNEAALLGTLTGEPAEGSYQFTPIQKSQAHQLLSNGFANLDDPLGAGSFSFQFGGFINKALLVDDLNDGQGVQRGQIRITDRSGSTAVVDLRFVQTVDDVLQAINETGGINITAVADGDALKLIDNSGGSGNLQVEEVGSGLTANDLGLSGINVAADEAVGQDLLGLYDGLALAKLNDGSGVDLLAGAADLDVSFRDGTSLQVDISSLGSPAQQATAATNAAAGLDAIVELTAAKAGAALNGVTISFVDDVAVTKGNETVVYDDSDPDNKTLTIHIDAGQTDANDVVSAINGDAIAGVVFSAGLATGSTGAGIISTSDSGVTSGGADAVQASEAATLGDILQRLNEADPARLQAQISAAGDRIELIDLTVDSGGTFAVTSLPGSEAAEDLGLTGAAVGGLLTSRRLQGGLKSPLLSSLQGGSGFGGLGQLDLTDRSGASATVDLSPAQTLDDVIAAINNAGIGITAAVNKSRNGLQLNDTTGATANNLIVANGADGLTTADKLNLTFDAAATSVDSGSFDLQTVNRRTRLDEYNGGINDGTFLITDSAGAIATINTAGTDIETIGDVIDAINNSTVNVEARINDRGDGIVVIDNASGSGTFEVRDLGTGTAAADLRIAGLGASVQVGGQTELAIVGSSGYTVDIDSDDTLQDLVTKINDLNAGASASIFSAGSGTAPHRISLLSQTSGTAGELLVDASGAGFNFDEITAAQDALLLFGGGVGGGGVLIASPNDRFDDVLDGVSLTINEASIDPVSIAVESSNESLVSSVQSFVDQFNLLRDKLDELTFFDEVRKLDRNTLRVERNAARRIGTISIVDWQVFRCRLDSIARGSRRRIHRQRQAFIRLGQARSKVCG